MKNILKYIGIICVFICFFPICVYADSATYTILTEECLYMFDTGTRKDYAKVFTGSDVRITLLHKNSAYTLYFISQNPFTIGETTRSQSSTSSCPASSNYSGTQEGNYYKFQYAPNSPSNFNIPVVELSSNENNNLDRAIYYTFGDGAVGPTPTPEPINWGLLRDVEYSTRIAGNGSAAVRNVDYLKWDTVADANGNDISECEVEIQAVPGNFSGTTYENLLNQTYQNFNIGNYGAVNLGTMPATSGTFSVSWSYILNHLGWSMDSLYAHFENELWLKTGWYYQIRLLGSDDYTGQWQTMYTPLSQGAAASETVINQNSFNMNIYQVYEQLTQINNNTSITINIEDTDYTIQNPDDGDEPQEGTDLWDILKQMLNGIFQIVKNIAALPGKFLEMLKSLFMLPNDYSEFGERLDTEVNNYMEENQPGLLAIQDGTADIKETLEATSPSGSGQYPQCTFTWDAVTLDLSDFNAGTVTFFAAGSFDFTAAFIQMIEGFGMTYSDYQFYTSAVIYLWVVVFIYRHVNTFLKGGGETKSG